MFSLNKCNCYVRIKCHIAEMKLSSGCYEMWHSFLWVSRYWEKGQVELYFSSCSRHS